MNAMFRRVTLMAASIAAAAMLLSGCSGSDGANGINGTNGFRGYSGAQGPAGPVTLTNESCLVCHNTNDVASVANMHDFTFNATTGTRTTPRLNEKNLAVSNVSVAADASGKPVVTFTIKNGTAAYTGLAGGDLRMFMAGLVPANTTTSKGKFSSPYFQTWAYERSIPAAIATVPTAGSVNSTATAGVYQYTFPNAFNVASSTNSTIADKALYTSQRVYVRLAANSTTPGVGGGVAVLDFLEPAAGATAVAIDTQNQYVTIDACKKCHGPQMNGAAHANSYLDTLGCVMCHSPLSNTGAPSLPNFIHEIHAAIDVPEFPTRILGAGYKDVTYPQPISNCVACHTATTAQKTAMGTGNKIDNWKDNPSAEVCGSCHAASVTGVTTTAAHGGGANKTAASCVACHDAAYITAKHNPAPAAKDVPEYDVTMTITDPANAATQIAAGKLPYYVAGETPTVTVTLKNHADGSAVAGTLYTTLADTKGVAGGGLNKAQIYVYGPRANAKPVLTKAALTLSAAGVPTQAQKLFVSSADANILTDANGFKYKLNAIPADMVAGTYMVRFTGADYSYVSDTDYKIDSVAFQTIQVGTATVEQKLSGNGCVDCHGTGNLEIHNARHSVVFDTDQCISCHDKSGNHADPIDNRVHAIHGASAKGDLLGLDWSKVTYPQGIPTVSGRNATTGLLSATASAGAPRCITCHTSTSTAYKGVSVSYQACIGCHSDKRGAVDHLIQNGGK